jgi:hypothetical protein
VFSAFSAVKNELPAPPACFPIRAYLRPSRLTRSSFFAALSGLRKIFFAL